MEHSSIKSKRIAYLDVAKGVGILLVLLGHNYVKASIPGMEKLIFSFHMPFFFLLSGMLFNPNYPLLVLFKRRFKTLLRPYLVTILLLYSIYFFYTDIKVMTILRRIGRSFYASGNYIEWAQLWFLPHLFILNLFVGVLFLLFYMRVEKLWIRIIFLAGMLWIGVAFLPVYYMKEATIAGKAILLDGLPASIDLLLITATFFLAGYEIKQYIPERFFTSLWTLGITGGLLITLNIIFPYRMDFFFRTYDSYLVNTIEAFSGIIFTLALSSRIALKRNWLYRTLNYFGRITIILLIFHQPAQTMTFQHMMQIIKNPYLAGLVSFLAAIGVPVLVYQLILKNSPRLANWFGLLHPGRSSKEKSQEQPAN